MSAWGLGVFEDDVALDVRGLFEECLAEGISVKKATALVLENVQEYLDDPHDGLVVWLSLATLQWEKGKLEPAVKDRALEIIDSGRELERWGETEGGVERRREILLKLRDDLISGKRPPRGYNKPFKSTNPWPIGTIAAYRLLDETYIAFRVIGECAHQTGKDPIVEVLDWKSGEPPSEDQLDLLKPGISVPEQNPMVIGAMSETEAPLARLQVIGKIKVGRRDVTPITFTLWRFFDGILAKHFRF